MEKRKNRIFMLGLVFILSIISVVFSVFCKNAIYNDEKKFEMTSDIKQEMLMFMLDQIRVIKPSYSVLELGDGVTYSISSELKYIMEENLLTARDNLADSPNFAYRITDMETGKKTENGSIEKLKEEHQLYTVFYYDDDGSVTSEGDYISTDFSYISAYQILRRSIKISAGSNQETYTIYGVEIPKEDIKANMPKNIKVEFAIPNTIINNGDFISTGCFVSSYIEHESDVIVILMCVMIFVIGFYMIVYPVKIVQEVNPFAFMRKIKAEIKWLFFIVSIVLLYLGMAYAAIYTVRGVFKDFLIEVGIEYSDAAVMLLLFAITMLAGFFTSMGVFEFKYMLTSGFVRYWKEDSLIGSVCRFLKKKFEKLSEINLSSSIDSTIGKYILIQTGIIILISCFWGVGTMLAVIYGVVLFFYVKQKAEKIKNDYDVLLNATHSLSEGRFDEEITQDVGMFNGLKEEFKNIRAGFEKAVSEEIKSQNMKTELISNVSHDLKTPLTGIKNYVELLSEEDLEEETRKKYLENLCHYTDRLNNLIEDLFEVSKVNSGNIQLNKVELNVNALILQAQAETEEMLLQKNLKVVTQLPQKGVLMTLDGDKTYRIFENLFTNIGKYTMPNTRVYINMIQTDDYIDIIFKNISQEQMNFTSEEIVERFVRGDKSRHENGSGIGLAIVKSFTEIQNGEFNIEVDGDLFKAIVRFYKVS